MVNDKIKREQIIFMSLDDMIEKDSVVRTIDKYVKSLDIENLGYHIYTNKVGRPAYDVRELIALYLYSYMNQVMSSRQLEKQTYINVEIMWLLNRKHPDHSTIAAFRSKNSDALVNTFREFTLRCINAGIIEGKTIAVDGTKFHASNSKKNNYSKNTLNKKIEHINEKIDTYFSEFDKDDEKSEENNEKIKELKERKEKYEKMLADMEVSEETQISTTDPDSRLMDNKKGGLDVGYNVQATVDSKSHMIIDQYVTNQPTDQHELSIAAQRAQEIIKNKNINVLADKGYYNLDDLKKCFEIGVTPIVAKQKASRREGKYAVDEFVYNQEKDIFICPQGKELRRISADTAKKYVYCNKDACKNCPNKENCFKESEKYKYRKITKDKDFNFMENADKIFMENKELYQKRQETIEHVFGTLKRTLGFAELHVRTMKKVSGEISLLCLAYNFKRMIKIMKKEADKVLIFQYIILILAKIRRNYKNEQYHPKLYA